MRRTFRRWTKKEESYLEKKYGMYSVPHMAKSLNRSQSSVYSKIAHMNLCQEGLSAEIIAKCFKVNNSVVLRWINDIGLPARKIESEYRTARYLIDPKEFWKWANIHKDEVNWNKYEKKTLLPEPDWVYGSLPKPKRTSNRKYTKFEIAKIKMMRQRNESFSRIAKELDASYNSIRYFCNRYLEQ